MKPCQIVSYGTLSWDWAGLIQPLGRYFRKKAIAQVPNSESVRCRQLFLAAFIDDVGLVLTHYHGLIDHDFADVIH